MATGPQVRSKQPSTHTHTHTHTPIHIHSSAVTRIAKRTASNGPPCCCMTEGVYRTLPPLRQARREIVLDGGYLAVARGRVEDVVVGALAHISEREFMASQRACESGAGPPRAFASGLALCTCLLASPAPACPLHHASRAPRHLRPRSGTRLPHAGRRGARSTLRRTLQGRRRIFGPRPHTPVTRLALRIAVRPAGMTTRQGTRNPQ